MLPLFLLSVGIHFLYREIKRKSFPSPILFLDFDIFRTLGWIPRYPSDVQKITENLWVKLDEIDRENSLLIFVSHRWLRGWKGAVGWDGKPHPDNITNGKYQLILCGIENIIKYLAPGMKCYLWIDYGCVNQDSNPAIILIDQLEKVIEACDCIFTPIYDEEHTKWQITTNATSWLEAYNSPEWNGTDFSYLNRGWCRLEMLFAANIPLISDSKERKMKFRAGLFNHRYEGKRRPHIYYGSKEQSIHLPFRFLEPLQNTFYDQYHPLQGKVSVDDDMKIIQTLITKLNPFIRKQQSLYEGDWENKKRNGYGKQYYLNGGVYEGYWVDDQHHGEGKQFYADGSFFVGEYHHGKRKHGKVVYPDGTVYVGEFSNFLWHGQGKVVYFDQSSYEGEWKENRRNGNGRFIDKNGTVFEGNWVNGRLMKS